MFIGLCLRFVRIDWMRRSKDLLNWKIIWHHYLVVRKIVSIFLLHIRMGNVCSNCSDVFHGINAWNIVADKNTKTVWFVCVRLSSWRAYDKFVQNFYNGRRFYFWLWLTISNPAKKFFNNVMLLPYFAQMANKVNYH